MMGVGVAHAQDVMELAPAQITEVEGFNPAAKRVYAQLSCEEQLFSTCFPHWDTPITFSLN